MVVDTTGRSMPSVVLRALRARGRTRLEAAGTDEMRPLVDAKIHFVQIFVYYCNLAEYHIHWIMILNCFFI